MECGKNNMRTQRWFYCNQNKLYKKTIILTRKILHSPNLKYNINGEIENKWAGGILETSTCTNEVVSISPFVVYQIMICYTWNIKITATSQGIKLILLMQTNMQERKL
jgi:hypothetical protein